jgi:hypothetical protein
MAAARIGAFEQDCGSMQLNGLPTSVTDELSPDPGFTCSLKSKSSKTQLRGCFSSGRNPHHAELQIKGAPPVLAKSVDLLPIGTVFTYPEMSQPIGFILSPLDPCADTQRSIVKNADPVTRTLDLMHWSDVTGLTVHTDNEIACLARVISGIRSPEESPFRESYSNGPPKLLSTPHAGPFQAPIGTPVESAFGISIASAHPDTTFEGVPLEEVNVGNFSSTEFENLLKARINVFGPVYCNGMGTL